MKRTIMIFVMLMVATVMFAEKVATLENIVDPVQIGIRDNKIYVLQRTNIFIYALKDFKLLKKFGKAGEGPKEFLVTPYGAPMSVIPYPDRLVINSVTKLSNYSLDGEYINEMKAPQGKVFLPFSDGYVAIGISAIVNNKSMLAFRTFDNQFQPVKTLYQTKIEVGNSFKIFLPMEALNYTPVYNDKLYIVNSAEGFVISCFGRTGEKEYSIKKEYQKIKMTSEYEEHAKNYFKTNPKWKGFWENISPGLTFEDYFPAIKDLVVRDNKLYAFTHKMKDNRNECVIMDLKGKELDRVFLEMPEREVYTFYPYKHAIDSNKYYILKENEDEENWELHVQVIKK